MGKSFQLYLQAVLQVSWSLLGHILTTLSSFVPGLGLLIGKYFCFLPKSLCQGNLTTAGWHKAFWTFAKRNYVGIESPYLSERWRDVWFWGADLGLSALHCSCLCMSCREAPRGPGCPFLALVSAITAYLWCMEKFQTSWINFQETNCLRRKLTCLCFWAVM